MLCWLRMFVAYLYVSVWETPEFHTSVQLTKGQWKNRNWKQKPCIVTGVNITDQQQLKQTSIFWPDRTEMTECLADHETYIFISRKAVADTKSVTGKLRRWGKTATILPSFAVLAFHWSGFRTSYPISH